MAGSANYIFMSSARQAVALGIVARKNVLLIGRGGHAKTELVDAIFQEAEAEGATTFTQSLHSDQSVADLYGGLDSDYAKEYIFDRYRLGESFLEYDLVRFEEILDAPPRVLCSLKDTLTSGAYRHGPIRHPMTTRCIIGCTNHNPAEVAKTDPSVEALLDRFPLVVNVEWPRYSATEFAAMFAAVDGAGGLDGEWAMPPWSRLASMEPPRLTPELEGLLGSLLATAVVLGCYVSPRMAIYAREILRAWVALCDETGISSLDILRLLAPLRENFGEVWEAWRRIVEVDIQRAMLEKLRRDAAALTRKLARGKDASDAVRGLEVIRANLGDTKWHDSLVSVARRASGTVEDVLATAGQI